MKARPALSVVVPALDEEAVLPDLISDIRHLGPDVEIVVVDGGSSDATARIASQAGARVIAATRGRGPQLAAGAAVARGHWLLFLHADTRMPGPARSALSSFIAKSQGDEFAHFRFRLDRPGAAPRSIEWGQRLRESVFGLPYGDQGLLVRHEVYLRAGGYPDWPLFEDVELVRRLRRIATRRRLPADLPTSARRFGTRWPLGRSLRNSALLGLYLLGVSPHRLATWYGRRPRARTVPGAVVVVLARAPRLGTVKTRLARDVGDEAALRIYRSLGRRVVDEARKSGFRTVVAFTPRDAEDEVRAWLGDDAAYTPQPEGDLGERMYTVWREVLDQGAPVACLIGTDLPGMTSDHLTEAFSALKESDLVLGPATDGGYYLIGGATPSPSLFRDIPWSTDRVRSMTLERAADSGLSAAQITMLSDVDTVADLPPELRAG